MPRHKALVLADRLANTNAQLYNGGNPDLIDAIAMLRELGSSNVLANLLDLTLKLKYEHQHMTELLTRMGMAPHFPEYGAAAKMRDEMLGRKIA